MSDEGLVVFGSYDVIWEFAQVCTFGIGISGKFTQVMSRAARK
jgi:hypothetical protein